MLMGQESVDNGPAALSEDDPVLGRNYPVEKLVARLDSYGHPTTWGNHNVNPVQGLRIWPEEAKAVFLLIHVHEMNHAGPRRNLDFAAGGGSLVSDLNGSGPGQGLLS